MNATERATVMAEFEAIRAKAERLADSFDPGRKFRSKDELENSVIHALDGIMAQASAALAMLRVSE